MGNIIGVYRLKKINSALVPKRTFEGHRTFAKVYDIYDGDTITIICRLDRHEKYRLYKLRLAGLDAPEKKPIKTMPNRELHIRAANKVIHLLTQKINGAVISIDFQAEEKYGRTMGVIWTIKRNCTGQWIRKENINQWLIDNNLVMKYEGDTKKEFSIEQLEHIIKFN